MLLSCAIHFGGISLAISVIDRDGEVRIGDITKRDSQGERNMSEIIFRRK